MTLKQLIKSDFKRCGIETITFRAILHTFVLVPVPGLKYMTIFRITQHYRYRNRMIFYFSYLWLRGLKYKYGYDISYRTTIGKGLYIGHFGGITIHGDAVIGENCNISQGITIGVLVRGKNAGVPTIGDRVFIGPGAVILGGIKIGNDALIGTNSVVNFDVPEKAVVATPVASIISDKGSGQYISNTA
ncbi:MAG TPA: serine acetyltransferase [Flavobacterium sp.]